MTANNPVQDRIDTLEAAHDHALELLERALDLAGRQSDRRLRPPRLAATIRLAVVFHRRAAAAAADLTDLINYLEKGTR
ncbi:hypothetical protein [Streptomyces sp. x-19]|uniref:hypothetical protein n=1 Tax=Streptomyces sp. x-19 TaxID=2789280 RepID=UPI00397E9A6C